MKHNESKWNFSFEMVIYIEACESGSMFEGLLPTNINVYATTASNAEESSYACYYDEKRKTYLGDVYSVVWMEDSDAEQIDKESLFQQYSITQKNTNTSHVMQYGNLVRFDFVPRQRNPCFLFEFEESRSNADGRTVSRWKFRLQKNVSIEKTKSIVSSRNKMTSFSSFMKKSVLTFFFSLSAMRWRVKTFESKWCVDVWLRQLKIPKRNELSRRNWMK